MLALFEPATSDQKGRPGASDLSSLELVLRFGENGAGFARSEFTKLGDKTIIAASHGHGFGASGGLLMLRTAAQELLIRRFAVAHAVFGLAKYGRDRCGESFACHSQKR